MVSVAGFPSAPRMRPRLRPPTFPHDQVTVAPQVLRVHGNPGNYWAWSVVPVSRVSGMGHATMSKGLGGGGCVCWGGSSVKRSTAQPQRSPAFLKLGRPLPDRGSLDHRRRFSFLGGDTFGAGRQKLRPGAVSKSRLRAGIIA
jgi:hypothetical protein